MNLKEEANLTYYKTGLNKESNKILNSAIHNAMAKIKIDTNQNPQQFLATNQFYDPKVIGKFC